MIDISKNITNEVLILLKDSYDYAYSKGLNYVSENVIAKKLLERSEISGLLHNVDLEALKTELDSLISREDKPVIKLPSGVVVLSPDSQKFLLLSYLTAKKYSRLFVHLEDLLLSFEEMPNLSVIAHKFQFDFKKIEEVSLSRLGGQHSTLSDNSTPSLNKYSVDMTAQAQDGLLHKAIGRDKEIEQVIRVLSRESKSNAILLGEAGVGKTAIAEGFAQKIADHSLGKLFENVRIVNLNLISILAAATTRGAIEDLLNGIIDEVKRSSNIILFIDEIHLITGGGNTSEASIISNILKPALARGELHVIGATTLTEYRKYIEKDPALSRRFEPIKVEEPNIENSIIICTESSKRLKNYHKVEISDTAIKTAVELSKRYITDRFLPDKAIDLLDEACSHAVMEKRNSIDENDIKLILSEKTGIPIQKLSESDTEKLTKLEDIIRESVIGQEEAIKEVSEVIRRSRAGLKDHKKPIGSFLFLGPSGVGKTELAKAVAKVVYDTEKAMIRLDMSEFSESHTVQRLIGAPPGYVGYEEGGQLTNPIWERPYSLILLDEIEKAHPKVFDIFLQVLDDGRLTDGQGRTVDFKNTIIIATSNIASSEILEAKESGVDITDEKFLNEELYPILKEYFRPEFINRFDEIVVFNPLTKEALKVIAKINIQKIEEKLKDKKIKVNISEEILTKIADETYNPQFGARPAIRMIQDTIENNIANQIIDGSLKDGDTLNL